jgi:ribosomal protein S18 acetylase RimI-like enzyme
MNSPDISILIENNLAGLYRKATLNNNGVLHIEEDMEWVINNNSAWPSFVYNACFDDSVVTNKIDEILELIRAKVAPSWWITGPSLKVSNFKDIIEKAGMRQMMQWPGMALDLNKLPTIQMKSPDLEIKQVKNEMDLVNWIKITESELFDGKKLNKVLFENLLNDPDISLYLGLIEGIPVATIGLHFDADTAGIYMVATTSSYRSKGIGTAMTLKALEDAKKNGHHLAVLEATAISEKMYHKIGFESFCNFDIYWMVGKEYK